MLDGFLGFSQSVRITRKTTVIVNEIRTDRIDFKSLTDDVKLKVLDGIADAGGRYSKSDTSGISNC